MIKANDRVVNKITGTQGIVIKKSLNGKFYLIDYTLNGNVSIRWSYYKNIEAVNES